MCVILNPVLNLFQDYFRISNDAGLGNSKTILKLVMKLRFTKMHGLGNDFILIDARNQDLPQLSTFCREYSDRMFGIGFDQALILYPSRSADFRMDIYNADGSQVEMCGNGIRCFAKYIWDRGISGKSELAVETLAGIIRPVKKGDLIQVDMGEPILDG